MSELPPTVDAAQVAHLLALATSDEQITYLQSTNLFNPAGLSVLVAFAGALVRRDPLQAQRLAAVCLDLAPAANASAIIPRAAYLKAQTHAIAGELDTARQLIQMAQTAYQADGQEEQALATNVGLMHILAEMGQYQEALAAGQAILDRAGSNPPPEYMMMAAQAAQNMGLCYRRLGQYESALQSYQVAEAHYQALSLPERIGDISNNRGVLLMEIGRGGDALDALETALDYRTAAGQTFLQAQTANNLGSTYLLLGNYSKSLAMFEQARQLLATQDGALDQQIVLLDTAHAYLALNLYEEAIAIYREVEQALAAAGASHHRALALWGLGAALLAQAALDEAEQVLAAAVALLQDPPTPLLATVLLEQAAAQVARRDLDAARDSAGRALQLALDYDWPLPALYAHLRLSDIYLDEWAEAERHLLAAQPLVETLGLPHLRYRWLERYGRLRRRQGQDGEAQQFLEAAIETIEQLRGSLSQEALRASFLQDKVMAYDELVQLFLARGDLSSWQQAFAVTEQAKSRALVDLMSGVVTAQITLESDRLQQLHSLQANLNALYNELLATGSGGERRIPITDIQAQAARLEQEIRQQQLQAANFDFDTLTTMITPESLLAQIPAGITLLSYYCLGEELLAFVYANGQITVRQHLCRIEDVQKWLERLNVQWGRFRTGGDFVQQHLPQLERTAAYLLGKLYEMVFAPLEPLLTGVTGLVVVPHGPLHHLPFPALFDGQDYLVERFEISYAPSTAVFHLCQERQPRPVPKTVVIGVPDPAIPEVRQEVMAVAGHAPASTILMDEDATLAALTAHAPECTLLHLACHGIFRADNSMFSALRLYDGWLTAGQALQLELDGPLVVLSGCDTGMNKIINGDELLGLSRAFLGAGAAGLIVSLWLAHDQTTAELMATLYAQFQRSGGNRAAALRQAQRSLKDTYPHPFYWAPFILVGQRSIPAGKEPSSLNIS